MTHLSPSESKSELGDRWLHEIESRKVNKYSEIHYKSQKFHIPPSYSGTKVEVIEYEDKIKIYYRERLLITHPYKLPILSKKKSGKSPVMILSCIRENLIPSIISWQVRPWRFKK